MINLTCTLFCPFLPEIGTKMEDCRLPYENWDPTQLLILVFSRIKRVFPSTALVIKPDEVNLPFNVLFMAGTWLLSHNSFFSQRFRFVQRITKTHWEAPTLGGDVLATFSWASDSLSVADTNGEGSQNNKEIEDEKILAHLSETLTVVRGPPWP